MQNKQHRRSGPYAIIADDLTGALDTGVHFISAQSHPLLRIANGSPLDLTNMPFADVLVLDTETRLMTPREAYSRIRSTAAELVDGGYLSFYKKIDSTYRGNVGAEIDAMLDLLGYPAAAVVSAVPMAGRIVQNGICLVREVPLHESESGTDRLSPQMTSSIREIVASQSARQSVVIDHTVTSLPPLELASDLERRIMQGAEILLFDAATDDDIRRIVKALRLVPEPLLLAGAAGMARALTETDSPASTGTLSLSGPGLFISGSLMQTTAEQADRLAGHTDRVASLALRPDAVVSSSAREMNRIVEGAIAAAESGRHILLRTTTGHPVPGFPIPGLAAADVARFVARCARRIVEATPVGTLVVSGGSTAIAMIEALGVTNLRVTGEVESGLPVCEAEVSPDGRHYRIVTKAGGFGEIDSYERIMEMMDATMRRRHDDTEF